MFDKFPSVKERVQKLFKGLHDQLATTIIEGNRREWLLSEAKNDAMVERLCRRAGISPERAKEWLQPNMAALEAFQGRKERGMNLSERVWRLTDQFKGELEMALELGLGDGKSAADLSRDVRKYLNEPHKLFRRVRNEKGQLRLSKSAAAYHPGQGVYRSSYKNALRLTATENNMAYRTADHDRWQRLDFVTGIEIMLSNNHPKEDICDELVGVYPKTFKFVGWHPLCRCIAVPKLADEDEFIAREQARIDGEEEPGDGYSGEVTEMPEAFNNWVRENAERIENAKNEPYFIRDNKAAVEIALSKAERATPSFGYVPWIMKPSYIDEATGLIGKVNALGTDAETYNSSPMAGINLGMMDDGVREVAASYGINVDNCRLQISTLGARIDWRAGRTGRDFEMSRFFRQRDSGEIIVEHSLFALGDAYQGKGVSKKIFRELYKHYQGIGVAKIEVHANLDRGGYTWAKYGFYADNRAEAEKALGAARRSGHKNLQLAESIIEEYYEKKLPSTPFPMQKIAALPDGKGLLLNADWHGFIDLRNAEQRAIFEAYIGL